MPEASKEVIGPYEQWVLRTGARYTFANPRNRRTPYLMAMAELPAGSRPADIAQSARAIGGAPGEARIHLPTMWAGEVGPAGQAKSGEPLFCPLALELAEGSDAIGAALEAVASLRTQLSKSAGAPKDPNPPAGGDRVSPASASALLLNTYIPETTFNRGFDPDAIATRYPKDSKRGRPPAVIMAVIDDGIPFAHRNLRDRDGASRVEFCWLQGGDAVDPKKEPQTVLFGREYTGEDITAAIARFGGDEDALYRGMGAVERGPYPGATIDRFGSHGAHVIAAAAGHRHGSASPALPVGPEGDLDSVCVIAVQLPAPTTLDTVGFGKDAFVLSAFHYIFDRADRIAERYLGEGAKLPLIINFSYGFSGGPHNGCERLERALNGLIRRRGFETTHLVMPAGNDFLNALHGAVSQARLKKGDRAGSVDEFEIPWRIQPTDRTSNYLEIWLPEGTTPQGIVMTITDPRGRQAYRGSIASLDEPVRHEDIKDSTQAHDAAIGLVSLEFYRTGQDKGLWRFFVALAPTEPEDPAQPGASAGLWKIKLENLGQVTGDGKTISCRIQRDHDPFGYSRGARQSYFHDLLDERFDDKGQWTRRENPDEPFVRRLGTLNGLATHDAVTVVGGCIADSSEPAEYSSAGPDPSALLAVGTVHYSAPSETSRVLPGVVAGGTRSGSAFRLSGTSTAAPQVSRALAVAYLSGTSSRAPKQTATASQIVGNLLAKKIHKLPQIKKPIHPDEVRARSARLGKGLLFPK
ncbi:MAG TPA: S8 family serine peptidase [Beijerinckiaceae bacterium]|jgi:hypothetical protein